MEQGKKSAQRGDESFASVAEFAPAMLWRGDAQGKCVYLNRAQREFWGVAEDGVGSFSWSSTLLEEDAHQVYGPFSEGMSQQKPFQCEARYRRADGAIRVLQTRAEPYFDGDGAFIGMIGVNTDVTEERAAQAEIAANDARRRLLMSEMSHRIKNMLSTVLSISAQTGRSAKSYEEFSASFQARLTALARSHDLLMRDAHDTADLREILEFTLRPYAVAGDQRALVLDGDAVRLGARAAVGFALVAHELATNAAKYGAFAAAGSVEVRWSFAQSGDSIALSWRESGGPAVSPPSRAGFGSRLIQSVVSTELSGAIDMRFDSAGFEADLTFRASGAEAPDG